MSQEQAVKITKALANQMLVPVREFQKALTNPGRDAVLTILDAMAWNAAVMIARLPRNERKRLRDYVVSRFDEGIDALKDTPTRYSVPTEEEK
jgi:hypothetical protein